MIATDQTVVAERYPPASPELPSTSSTRQNHFAREGDEAERPLLTEDNESYNEDLGAIAAGEDQ